MVSDERSLSEMLREPVTVVEGPDAREAGVGPGLSLQDVPLRAARAAEAVVAEVEALSDDAAAVLLFLQEFDARLRAAADRLLREALQR